MADNGDSPGLAELLPDLLAMALAFASDPCRISRGRHCDRPHHRHPCRVLEPLMLVVYSGSRDTGMESNGTTGHPVSDHRALDCLEAVRRSGRGPSLPSADPIAGLPGRSAASRRAHCRTTRRTPSLHAPGREILCQYPILRTPSGIAVPCCSPRPNPDTPLLHNSYQGHEISVGASRSQVPLRRNHCAPAGCPADPLPTAVHQIRFTVRCIQ